MKFNIIIVFLLFSSILYSQSYYDWESYTINEFYSRIDLEYGTLDQNGYSIDYIYVVTSLEAGTYEIEITDADGDMYEIKNTDIYLSFTTYYGYSGYSYEGILEVSAYGNSTFYKKDY